MQEQQLTQFYDKLLHYLNRTYFTNIRIQQLYLDLKKHTRKLRFKSIKNIYNTLTEGKADEVIYSREKPLLMKNTAFNQNYTQRTCWRLIQKLINKVAYYLMNEKKLNCLAPSILKALNFTRNAPDKVTHKSAFVQFFSQVLDSLIAQNNLMEQKIYELLIERGYIYSIDQFYRMSRFEGPDSDFTYANTHNEDEDNIQQDNQETTKRFDFIKINSSKNMLKSKKRMMSIKKFVHNRNKSRLEFDINSDEIGQGFPDLQQNIAEEQSEIQMESDEQSQSQQVVENLKYNKIAHNIHNQLEKVVDQIMNHKDFGLLLTASDQQGIAIIKNDEKLVTKEPIIKQVLKNLKIKNFKANQKLINMNGEHIKLLQPQRKNSKPKERKQFKSGYRTKNHIKEQGRSSIATALSSRLKQKVFQNSGIQQIKELIVRNLGNLKDKFNIEENQGNQSQNQILGVRKNKRLRTQNFEAHLEQNAKKMQRKSSNLNFLKNAFVFNPSSKPRMNFLQPRNPKYTDILNQTSRSSQNMVSTVKTIGSIINNKMQTKQSQKEIKEKLRKSLFSNEKIAQISRFAQNNNRCGHFIEVKDFRKGRTNQFNTNLLELAAKKYHRYQTEQNRRQSFQELFNNFQTLKNLNILKEMENGANKHQKNTYMHHRRYQTFDRIQRRIF